MIDAFQQALGERYRISRELGRGGMATVYLADDMRYERPVALKVLRPELNTVQGAERFHREVRTAARLQHPNLVPVFDSGVSGGMLWYVMPYIEGESLRQRLEHGPLEVADAIAIARGVSAALDYAHRHGILHRDIKPENILLHEGGAMLADFGIARLVAREDTRLTETGLAIGTLAYMSPEQAAGEREVDARSDIYSLGAVMFEMLTGAAPFSGTGALAQRFLATAPSLAVSRPDVPASVTIAVGRALSGNPADRYATAMEFANALVVRGTAPDESAPGSLAVLPFANLSHSAEDEDFSDGMTDELINALGKVEGLRVVSRTSAFAFKGQALDVRSIGLRLNVGAVLEGSVRRAGHRLRVTAQLVSVANGYHLWSGSFDRQMDDVFQIQDEISRAIVSTLRVKLLGPSEAGMARVPTRDMDAYTSYLKGRQLWNKRSVEALWQGLAHFERALQRDPDFALAHLGVADSHVILGFYSAVPPGEAFPRARESAERALAIQPDLSEAFATLAYIKMYHEWDWRGAEELFRRTIALNPGHSTAHQWYGNFLTLMGRSDEGVASFGRAVELDPLSAVKTAARGWGLYFGRRYEEAIAECERALEIDPDSVVAHMWKAQATYLLGRHGESVASSAEAVRLTRREPMVVARLAAAQAAAGREEAARTLLQEVLAATGRRYVSPVDVAEVYVALGERANALDWLERGLRERTHWMALLKVEPKLDPLREEPRFKALLQEMKFV